MTVRAVVKAARVSERTVRGDIGTGRLSIVRFPNGRVLIPKAALATYRLAAHTSDELVTVRQLAQESGASVRTVRRWISKGELPAVRVSPRRLYIRRTDATAFFDYYWSCRQPVVIREPASAPTAPTFQSPYLLAEEVAALANRTLRGIYHDISKGALRARYRGWRILIRREDAAAYVGK